MKWIKKFISKYWRDFTWIGISLIAGYFTEGLAFPLIFIRGATLTVYPEAGDGVVNSDSGSWDTAHDTSTGVAGYTATGGSFALVGTQYFIYRGFFPFDTSALGAGATISATNLDIYLTNVDDADNDGNDWINVVQTSQVTSDSLTVEDFDQCGAINNPIEGATRLDLSSLGSGAYTTWTLNATGIGWINKTGITYLGMREGHDAVDIAPNVSTWTGANCRFSEYAGTDSDPKLVITYDPATPTFTPKMMIY